MKSYIKILLILIFSILITVFVSPIIASVLPFHLYKITSRVVLIVTFFLFYSFREIFEIHSVRSLGFNLNKKWWGQLGIGFILALISIGVIAFIMLHFYIRYVVADITTVALTQHLIGYLLTGFTVALIEETFFRGFILQSLIKDTHIAVSLLLTNIFYSAVHFLKPENLPGNIGILNLSNSLNSIPLFFKPLLENWINIWPSFIGLFLVGMVLSLAYLRTRSLAMSVGLHAGWVLCIKSLSFTTDVATTGSLWVSGKIIESPVSWAVMMVFCLLLGKRKDKGIVKD